MTLRTGERDLHSGLYGGAALNAAHALIQTLGAVVARRRATGRAAPRRGSRHRARRSSRAGASCPAGAGELADQGARPADPSAAEEFYLRTFAEPSLDVNGIETGSPHLEKTVLPVQAVANVSIRLAPGQQVDQIAATLDAAAARGGARSAPSSTSSCSRRRAAGIVPPDATAIQLGLNAFERALGVRPLLIRSGGSLPIVAAFADKRIPTVITGFALPNSNLHSPNERLLAEYVPRGIAAARALFEEFAAL